MTFTTAGVPSPIVQPGTLPLLAIPAIAFPTETGKVSTTVKTLTKAQKLGKALKVCEQEAKDKRAACKKQARKKYGPKPTAKKGTTGRK